MVRIVVVDDQQMVRAGFMTILGTQPDLEVVGEASNGEEALSVVRRLRPDVVCMDVQMPVVDGLESTRRIVAEHGDGGPRVLILTTFDRDDYVRGALEAGASGFVLKNSSPEDLIGAVRVVAEGHALLSPQVTRRVIEAYVAGGPGPSGPDGEAERVLERLTEREREVLGHLAAGLSNADIARTMVVGEATAKTHVSNILAKLGVRDRVGAVIQAYELGVVRPGGTAPGA